MTVKCSIFQRTAEEIEEIYLIAKENNIPIKSSIFCQNPKKFKDIIDISKNKFKIGVDIFESNTKRVRDNVVYIEQTYGKEYLSQSIVMVNT